eukprot:scaffold185174_cov21-Tisochrysis_lutea.AAC.1
MGAAWRICFCMQCVQAKYLPSPFEAMHARTWCVSWEALVLTEIDPGASKKLRVDAEAPNAGPTEITTFCAKIFGMHGKDNQHSIGNRGDTETASAGPAETSGQKRGAASMEVDGNTAEDEKVGPCRWSEAPASASLFAGGAGAPVKEPEMPE